MGSSSFLPQLSALRKYFNSGVTRDFTFRKKQLIALKKAIYKFEKELYAALGADLKKSPEESWVTELGMVVSEINATLKGLKDWMAPETKGTNLLNMPSSSSVIREPLGVVLVIGPWNYPFQLLINPLVGAIAAGNTIVLKPSEFAPATAAVMKKMIADSFPPDYIFYAEGEGAVVIPAMMKEFRFNHVFYTGSTAVGKIIYKMAAEELVPVTLELGGKSPCVVEEDANIHVAARRIAITKFSNAGQMCVAPDYILVHESKQEELISEIKKAVKKFFSEKPEDSYSYCRIINERQFNRLQSYLSQGTVVAGGRTEKDKLYIEPTILTHIALDSPVMNEEIFGPILPVIPFRTTEEARAIIDSHPDPLAFYIFTSSKSREKQWLNSVSFGGGCVNNASWHLTNHHLPFGGRGFSGTGSYHGRFSFEAFSHKKAIMKTPTWFDPDIKYPPFKGKLKLFKWVIR